jgi:hypothetical protein
VRKEGKKEGKKEVKPRFLLLDFSPSLFSPLTSAESAESRGPGVC